MIPLPPLLADFLNQVTIPTSEQIQATGNLLRDLDTIKLVVLGITLAYAATLVVVYFYIRNRGDNRQADVLEGRIHDLEKAIENLQRDITDMRVQTLDLLSKTLAQNSHILRLRPAIEKAIKDEGHDQNHP